MSASVSEISGSLGSSIGTSFADIITGAATTFSSCGLSASSSSVGSVFLTSSTCGASFCSGKVLTGASTITTGSKTKSFFDFLVSSLSLSATSKSLFSADKSEPELSVTFSVSIFEAANSSFSSISSLETS